MIRFSIAAFAEAARAIRNIPGSGMGIDIYTHARIDARKTSMTLTMSDGDIEAHATINCDSDAAVLAAIPAAVLDFFIARSGLADDAGTIEFDADMRNVTGRHGKARLTLGIMPGGDFFLMEPAKPDWTMVMRAHELCNALKRTEKALLSNASRPMFGGVFLHKTGDQARVIGANMHRMHMIDLDNPELSGDLPAHDGDLRGIILPPKTTKELQRIFGGDESEIRISGTKHMAAIEGVRLRVVTKLMDDNYFDYPNLVPKRSESKVTIQTAALKRALDGIVVAPKTDVKGKPETLRAVDIRIRANAIELLAAGDIGDAYDSVDATVEGVELDTPNAELRFSAQFLRDALDASESKSIEIYLPVIKGHPFFIVDGERATFGIGQRRL